jgi:hypothetical protein
MRTIGRTIGIYAALSLSVIAMLACCTAVWATDLQDFTSDGCSLFPDGTIGDRAKWCECCFQHDIAYWRGGAEQERKTADEALRACVFERTGDEALAETMYLGVRAAGHPVFPTWYRWGYGWKFGRGYKPLTEQEQRQVREKQDDYARKRSAGYCGERSGKNASKERKEQ